jgi:hypothetical protein
VLCQPQSLTLPGPSLTPDGSASPGQTARTVLCTEQAGHKEEHYDLCNLTQTNSRRRRLTSATVRIRKHAFASFDHEVRQGQHKIFGELPVSDENAITHSRSEAGCKMPWCHNQAWHFLWQTSSILF